MDLERALEARHGRAYLVKAAEAILLAPPLHVGAGGGGQKERAARKARQQKEFRLRAEKEARKQKQPQVEPEEGGLSWITSRLITLFQRAAAALVERLSWERITDFALPDFFVTLYDGVLALKNATVEAARSAMRGLVELLGQFFRYVQSLVADAPAVVASAMENVLAFSKSTAGVFLSALDGVMAILDAVYGLYERAAQYLTCAFSAVLEALHKRGDAVEATAFSLFLAVTDATMPSQFDVDVVMDHYVSVLPEYATTSVAPLWQFLKDNPYVQLIGATVASMGAMVAKLASWLVGALGTMIKYLALPCFWALSQATATLFEALFGDLVVETAMEMSETRDRKLDEMRQAVRLAEDARQAGNMEVVAAARVQQDALRNAYVTPAGNQRRDYRALGALFVAALRGDTQNPQFVEFATEHMVSAMATQTACDQATAELVNALSNSAVRPINGKYVYETMDGDEFTELYAEAKKTAKRYIALLESDVWAADTEENAHQRTRAKFFVSASLKKMRLIELIAYHRGQRMDVEPDDDAQTWLQRIRWASKLIVGVVMATSYIMFVPSIMDATREAQKTADAARAAAKGAPPDVGYTEPATYAYAGGYWHTEESARKAYLETLDKTLRIKEEDVTCTVGILPHDRSGSGSVVCQAKYVMSTAGPTLTERITERIAEEGGFTADNEDGVLANKGGWAGRVLENAFYGNFRMLGNSEVSIKGFYNSLFGAAGNAAIGRDDYHIRPLAIGAALTGRYTIVYNVWTLLHEALSVHLFRFFTWKWRSDSVRFRAEAALQNAMWWTNIKDEFVRSAWQIALSWAAMAVAPELVRAYVVNNWITLGTRVIDFAFTGSGAASISACGSALGVLLRKPIRYGSTALWKLTRTITARNFGYVTAEELEEFMEVLHGLEADVTRVRNDPRALPKRTVWFTKRDLDLVKQFVDDATPQLPDVPRTRVDEMRARIDRLRKEVRAQRK